MPPAPRVLIALASLLTFCGPVEAAREKPPPPPKLVAESPTEWLLLLSTFTDYRPDEVITELHRRLVKMDYSRGRILSKVRLLSRPQRYLLARAAASYIKRQKIQTPTVRLCEQIVFVLGPEAVWALDAVAEDLSDRLGENHWYWAGRIIKRLGPRARPLLPRLVELIDRAGNVHSMSSEPIVVALGSMGPAAAPAVPGLLRLFEAPPTRQFDFIEPRNQAIIRTLGLIGPQAAEAEPLLKRIAREDSPSHFRTFATIAASRVLPHDAEIQQLVVDRLSSIDWTERGAMAEICMQNADALRPQVEAMLTDEMHSSSIHARMRAARALAALSAMPGDTLDSLALVGAQDPHPDLRAICISVLGKRQAKAAEARQVILVATNDPDSIVRAAADRAASLLSH